MELIPFNVNSHVRVRLTRFGREQHRRTWEAVWRDHKGFTPEYRAPIEDADGWSKWQMWSLMEEYGQYIGMARENPFETEILIERGRL